MKMQVETEVSVADAAYHMSEGERQHMANHLYKHYDVAPQKLRSAQEERVGQGEPVVYASTLKHSVELFERLAADMAEELQYYTEHDAMESWYNGRQKAYALAAAHIRNLIQDFSRDI